MTELQKIIVRTIQLKKTCSRKVLTNELGVTAAAITQNTTPLIENGTLKFLYQIESQKAGRKEEILELNKSAFFSIGIDISDRDIEIVQLDAQKEINAVITLRNYEDAYNYIKELDLKRCIGICISKRGYYKIENLNEEEMSFYKKIKVLYSETIVYNNVACLAYAYKYNNPNDENFLIVKYGPGVGSACFIGNHLLQSDSYPTYELGKVIVDDKMHTLEELIDYKSLGKKDEELIKECVKRNKKQMKVVIHELSKGLYNANVLLQLDKIIISGEIFQDNKIFNELIKEIKKLKNEEVVNKIGMLDSYENINRKKTALTAQYLYFYSK